VLRTYGWQGEHGGATLSGCFDPTHNRAEAYDRSGRATEIDVIRDFMQTVYRELAPSGTLRAAVNFGNAMVAQRDSANGAPGGLAVELADHLARRLSVPLSIVGFDGAVQTFEAGLTGAWDLAFLAIEQARREQLEFTAPFVVLEGTFLVRDDSPYRNVLDVDREGVRIAVGRGGFYDLRLTRTLRHAQLVRAPTNRDATELFLRDRLDALPGLRQPLLALAQTNPGLHVIEGRFSVVEQAIAVPRGHAAGLRYLNTFVEQVKSCDWFTDSLHRTFDFDHDVVLSASSR
jgi:polar amino acid transport system substrate-binding protein